MCSLDKGLPGMSQENRKAIRRALHASGFIYSSDGLPVCGCKVDDVSEGGAKLTLLADEKLPEDIIVSLSKDGKVRRHCRVVWTRGNKVGVRFKQQV